MFCIKCGNQLEENWKVCPNCGQRVDNSQKNGEWDDAGTPKGGSTPTPKKKRQILAIVAAICLVAVIFTIVCVTAFGNKEIPGNDLENLLSVSLEEIKQYGFIASDAVEGTYKTEDDSVYIIFGDSKPDMINMAESDEYCFHGIQVGMERMECKAELKDVYTLQFENEYQMAFLNDAGDIMVLTESEQENGEIARIAITCNKEYITQTIEAGMESSTEDVTNDAAEQDTQESDKHETDTDNDSPVSLSDEDKTWFITYNQFQSDGRSLFVEPLTDALMNVYWSDSDGNSVTWDFGLEPAEIGNDGAMIYYYGKDVSMSYYPDNHHIRIKSSNDEFAGDYEYVFDFNGGWSDSVSQRCYMEITCQNDIYYYVTIDWAGSASENYHWQFLAEYDTEQGCLVYQDGRCTYEYFPDDGGSMLETEVYTNGVGTIYEKDGKVYWDDQTENAGRSCIFVK